MHMGPVFCVRALVSSVAPASVDFPNCVAALAPFAHPFVEVASGRLQCSCIGSPRLDKSSIPHADLLTALRFFENLAQQP